MFRAAEGVELLRWRRDDSAVVSYMRRFAPTCTGRSVLMRKREQTPREGKLRIMASLCCTTGRMRRSYSRGLA
jgi:hypothetical protein